MQAGDKSEERYEGGLGRAREGDWHTAKRHVRAAKRCFLCFQFRNGRARGAVRARALCGRGGA